MFWQKTSQMYMGKKKTVTAARLRKWRKRRMTMNNGKLLHEISIILFVLFLSLFVFLLFYILTTFYVYSVINEIEKKNQSECTKKKMGEKNGTKENRIELMKD
jgi:hypothetical protein